MISDWHLTKILFNLSCTTISVKLFVFVCCRTSLLSATMMSSTYLVDFWTSRLCCQTEKSRSAILPCAHLPEVPIECSDRDFESSQWPWSLRSFESVHQITYYLQIDSLILSVRLSAGYTSFLFLFCMYYFVCIISNQFIKNHLKKFTFFFSQICVYSTVSLWAMTHRQLLWLNQVIQIKI